MAFILLELKARDPHAKVSVNHKHCQVVITDSENNIQKYCRGEKSMKHPFVIFVNVETNGKQSCDKDPENQKIKTISDRGSDCMTKFCEILKDKVKELIIKIEITER